MNIYPLPYSIPYEIVENTLNKDIKKEHEMSPLIPGKLETYIYDDEDSYFAMYQKSKFGVTIKKGGWDCLRHYEILANKCIPYFPDLDKCPKHTMFNFPKDMIKEVNSKYNDSTLTENEYNTYLDKLFEYTIDNLTCEKTAQYVLNTIQAKNNVRILFLSGNTSQRDVNYSRELLFIGLRKILGINVIDFPKIDVLYENCKNKQKYIGKGFTYGGKLKDVDIDRSNIEQRITENEFDFVFYGRVGKKTEKRTGLPVTHELVDLPYWNVVNKNYMKNNIVFIYGGDTMRNTDNECLKMHSENGICFVRELE